MSSKPVGSATADFWFAEEEKSPLSVDTAMLDTAMTSSAVFSSAMEKQDLLVSSDSEESDLEEGILQRLRNCQMHENFSPTRLVNAFCSGYLPSSQDNFLQLYQDLRATSGVENGKKRREAPGFQEPSGKRQHPGIVERTTSVVSATPSLKRAWNKPEPGNVHRKKFAVSERKSV